MKLLTKVAKGIAYGDVSNAAVRNILTELSKGYFGGITEQEMQDTMDYFDWKCPYTGKDLRPLLESGDGKYATDHIYPQNKDYCGLNVKGNLILVDRAANGEKGSKTPEEFFANPDSKVLAGVDRATRAERLQKIKDFQKKCGYDPLAIRAKISPLLEERYTAVRKEQEEYIEKVASALGVTRLTPVVSRAKGKTRSKAADTPVEVTIAGKAVDKDTFAKELIHNKNARFRLTYDSGAIKESVWHVDRLDNPAKMMSNIYSRPFWRVRRSEGLIRVEVLI